MRIAVFCRRFLCCLLICLLLVPVALAEVDLSSMSDEEIVELLKQVNQEVVDRGIEKTAELPAGKYVGGKDIPVGAYTVTCKTDGSHHGIIWVSAAGDDLENDYPSLLYEHVSFNEEEQFRVNIEEGGILCLPFTATVTISAGMLFR